MDDLMPILTQKMGGAECRVLVHRGFDTIEQRWRAAEQSLISSPYQRLGFCRAFMHSLGAEKALDPLIIELRNLADETIFLLPLAVNKHGLVRIARLMGGKHSNFSLPLFDESMILVLPAQWQCMFEAVAAHAGVDVFMLLHMPLTWGRQNNPLCQLNGQISSNSASKAALYEDSEQVLRTLRGAKAMKQIRAKERKLSEMGVLSFQKVSGKAEQTAALSAFTVQKEQWARTKGLSHRLDSDDIKNFFQALITENQQDNHALIDFYTLKIDDEYISIYTGSIHQQRLSLYTTSICCDEDINKFSPGDLLLKTIVIDACAQGVLSFDMGIGASETKRRWLPELEPMKDVFLGVGITGRFYALRLKVFYRFKRWVKRSPRLYAFINQPIFKMFLT